MIFRQKISEIVLLVHPFYSHKGKPWADISPYGKYARKNTSFFSGLWGVQIKKAGENPCALVVIVTPGQLARGYQEKFDDFIKFAEKSLGKRLILVDQTLMKLDVPEEIKRRGFRLSKKALKGWSFGEYFDQCVYAQTKFLNQQLSAMTKKDTYPERRYDLSMPGITDYHDAYDLRKIFMRTKRKQNKKTRLR